MQSGGIIIGQSPEIRRLMSLAKQVASTDVTVLLTGESGTGKEVFAKFIHRHSLRNTKTLIPVNCGAIPQGVLESELFGHEKGAFTGATQLRKGYFETADNGSIFLDEIGEMPLETQVKLLRVLETGEFQRVGASNTVHCDVRIIAATNRDLQKEVQEKRFREDLYFRLRTVELHLPPLRERQSDVLLLAEQFVHDFEKKHHRKFVGFTAQATEMLLRHTWPGNIRELRNLIESLIVLEHDEKITPEKLEKYLNRSREKEALLPEKPHADLDEKQLIYRALIQLQSDMSQIKAMMSHLLEDPSPPATSLLLPEPRQPIERAEEEPANRQDSLPELLRSFYDKAADGGQAPSLSELERYAIEETLKRYQGNKRKTAKALGITERTLYRKLNEYQIGKNSAGEN
ncbi:sigma54 specific transcriptional regulator, Fis family [Chloroherpeton thalassium ATCC 35110]|uniref:Sigma54 specific transcriptional regulator, Fis family n=1 Tax=Chloroherpeton thalassium (strain ATCC 35110 / GB-78) TaxID=517418 RepID=B3QXG8_CHLT3|nr:sigma-54 dependent transcriptional regulator [Chloroherpeton thalassium]ACF13442.1 sigma54 specific transcriptional regulator, Fis family [Chloroherpeton thalassium ATCC 35110]